MDLFWELNRFVLHNITDSIYEKKLFIIRTETFLKQSKKQKPKKVTLSAFFSILS